MTKLDWKIKKLEFIQWWINTPLYYLIFIKIGTILQTSYMLIRYKFDIDKINMILNEEHKDMRYRYRKEQERRVELTQKLNEVNRLNRGIGEKLNEKDNTKGV